MTDKDKNKLVLETIDIILANCAVIGIDFDKLPPKHRQLAIRMFIEGVVYCKQKQAN